MIQEKGSISIHTENIFPIIKKFLYSDTEIFVRELISNAVDATQKLKRLASLGEFKGELGDTTIQVNVDKDARTITITDQGIGMTAEEVKKYINQIAFSGATEFVEKFKDAKDANEIIGKFGLGFYSAFMVANKVEIDTLSYQENAEPALWVCDGSTSYELGKGTRRKRGTQIVLHINEDSDNFLNEYTLREILKKYGQFLPVPIQMGMQTNSEPDGEDADGKPKYKEVEVPYIINNSSPLWIKTPTDLKDEDYLAFYRELYPMSEDPLFWIHLNVDYPFNLTGVLYFPKVKNELELQRNKIKLYSRQVFITDEVKDIVPEFLMLLHGVIDSPDIPLNVSRSFLQADSNVKKINNYITRKVADKLNELFKNDRKGFEEKWQDIGLFIKYGMVSDEKFYEKAKDFALLQNVSNESFTISEYHDKVKENQTDKNDNIIYLYSNNVKLQHTYISSAQKRNYDVLLMDGPLDNHFISQIEQKTEKTQLKRIDADVLDKLIEKDIDIKLLISEQEVEETKEIFKNAIHNPSMSIEIKALQEDEMPITITMDEFMRRMKDMAKMGGGMMGMYGTLPDNYKLTVNGNHKLIKKILNTEDAQIKESLARQAFDLALLSQGILGGAELTAFVERSINMIEA